MIPTVVHRVYECIHFGFEQTTSTTFYRRHTKITAILEVPLGLYHDSQVIHSCFPPALFKCSCCVPIVTTDSRKEFDRERSMNQCLCLIALFLALGFVHLVKVTLLK